MKCVHCASVVRRSDWFCPECKRSQPERRPGGTRRVVLLGASFMVLGALLGSRLSLRLPARAMPVSTVTTDETPVVTVTPSPLPAKATAPAAETHEGPGLEASAPASRERPARPAALSRQATAGTASVSVVTDSSEPTYVYLNGGSLLGQAPLRNKPIPAGRQTLVFWSPSVGGRSTRTVDVEPGGSALVVENVRAQPRFGDATSNVVR